MATRVTLINLRGENKGAAEPAQVMHRPKRVGVNGRCTTCLGEDEGFHNRKRQGTRMSKVLGSLPNKKQDSHCNAKTVFRPLALWAKLSQKWLRYTQVTTWEELWEKRPPEKPLKAVFPKALTQPFSRVQKSRAGGGELHPVPGRPPRLTSRVSHHYEKDASSPWFAKRYNNIWPQDIAIYIIPLFLY